MPHRAIANTAFLTANIMRFGGRIWMPLVIAPLYLVSLLLLYGADPHVVRAAPGTEPTGHSVEVQMRNVTYHFTDSIAIQIRRLHGQLEPKGHDLPIFDDKDSFTVQIGSAEIAITPMALASVLNSYIFARSDAPLKDISIQIEGDRLKVKGKLHSKGDVAFETEGRLSATPEGKIRLHNEKVRALHLPVKGVMDLIGIEIGDLIKTGKINGVQVEKDDLILDPQTLLPPPHISGYVKEIRLERDNIVQIFQRTGSDTKLVPEPTGNYMAYRGNQLRFGKLTMADADMVLIDMDPNDPFDFYLDHYREQLVAGYTKETLSLGLLVFMRDYNKLPRSKVGMTKVAKTKVIKTSETKAPTATPKK